MLNVFYVVCALRSRLRLATCTVTRGLLALALRLAATCACLLLTVKPNKLFIRSNTGEATAFLCLMLVMPLIITSHTTSVFQGSSVLCDSLITEPLLQ